MLGETDLVALPDDVGTVVGNASVDDELLVSIGKVVYAFRALNRVQNVWSGVAACDRVCIVLSWSNARSA